MGCPAGPGFQFFYFIIFTNCPLKNAQLHAAFPEEIHKSEALQGNEVLLTNPPVSTPGRGNMVATCQGRRGVPGCLSKHLINSPGEGCYSSRCSPDFLLGLLTPFLSSKCHPGHLEPVGPAETPQQISQVRPAPASPLHGCLPHWGCERSWWDLRELTAHREGPAVR